MIPGIRCPNCGKLIAEKLEGILHFTCPRCKIKVVLDRPRKLTVG